ncbi:MAG: dihydrofolate reductase family protein [Gammaproteobacteria bacterium]|nr:dihydrofolate reductase family protein [Gammaproteobacteria bacterium]
MVDELMELYPEPGARRRLEGTYLAEDIHTLGSPERPFVYANFVTSLDGRIALADEPGDRSHVPKYLTSARDFRLFQELQAHADCLVTHSGYLRALAEGRLGDILQVGISSRARDIGEWRQARGLTHQPAVAIVSRSLDFPLPPSLAHHGQAVIIITGGDAPPRRVDYWRGQGYPVIASAPGALVDGAFMARTLGEMGYRRLYLLTGPRMLASTLADGVLARLYLTLNHRILGGEAFHTPAFGPELGDTGRLRMRSLHYDPGPPQATGQWFAAFETNARNDW